MRHPSLSIEQAQEWEAWRDFCNELNSMVPSAPNDLTWQPVFDAIRLWGERLVQLRLAHPEHTASALASAESAYAKVRTVSDEDR